MLRVRCQANATMDAKGRLALPAALKRACAQADVSGLVVTFHKGALWAWTPETFEREVEAPLMSRDPFADDVIDMVHALISPAQDVSIDGNGRILIPPTLRELAGLERDVVVHSVLDRVEIWDRETWERRFRESLSRRSNKSGMPRGEAS